MLIAAARSGAAGATLSPMGTEGGEPGAAPAVLGAVLAGGSGSRLGGAKPGVELGGRPLIGYPLDAVEEAGLEPLVVAKADSTLPPLHCRVLREPDLPRHPLCGIVAALREAGERPLVAVGCDMPFLDAGLLAWLGAAAEPLVVPLVGSRLQPLVARYDPVLLPSLEAAMERGEPLQRAVEALRPRLVPEPDLVRFGDPRRLCFNVNDRAALERAEALLGPQP
jgi:molybdopterin-guanine dinucleotide biosynthesis protein A